MNYEEMQTETMDYADDSDVTTEDMLSAFDEGWDDDGQPVYEEDAEYEMDEVDSDEAEADQQEAEDTDASETTEETDQSEGDETEGADQFLTVKHLGEEKKVSREEAIPYIQKGMDYDRKVSKLTTKIAEYEEFLNELASPGNLTIDQLIDSTRARMLMSQEARNGRDISETDAIFKVQQARAEKAKAEAEPAPQETKSVLTDENIQKFVAAYPNLKAEDIPQSVWEETHITGDLLGAYTRHENNELKKRIDALETNKRNERRSTGSRKTAGSGKARDAFDEGWDSI